MLYLCKFFITARRTLKVFTFLWHSAEVSNKIITSTTFMFISSSNVSHSKLYDNFRCLLHVYVKFFFGKSKHKSRDNTFLSFPFIFLLKYWIKFASWNKFRSLYTELIMMSYYMQITAVICLCHKSIILITVIMSCLGWWAIVR